MNIPYLTYQFWDKSTTGKDGEFRPSAKKLLEFDIPRQIFFEFYSSANTDDPHINNTNVGCVL